MSERLSNALQRVQAHIGENRNAFENNKRQTLYTLINPVLAALGWHTDDIHRVQHGFQVDRGAVDMALVRGGEPVALLEAKSLGTPLGDSEQGQLGQSCHQGGVSTAVLTNGAEWLISRVMLNSPHLEQRVLHHISLVGNPVAETAAATAAQQLSLLAHDQIEKLEQASWRLLLEPIWDKHGEDAMVEELSSSLRQVLARQLKLQTADLPLPEVSSLLRDQLFPKADSSQQTPTIATRHRNRAGLRGSRRAVILNGERFPITYKYGILTQTAEWLIKQGKLRPEHAPISHLSGQTAAVYHKNTPPPRPSARLYELSNGLLVDTNYATKDLVARAQTLLNHYDYPPDTLQLEGFDIDTPAAPPGNTVRPSPSHNRAITLNGEYISVKHAKDVLIQTAEWLIERNHIQQTDCPIQIGEYSTFHIIHTLPFHQDNGSFISPIVLSNDLFLEAHGRTWELIRTARTLLKRYGYSPESLQLKGFDENQGTARSAKTPTPTSPRQKTHRASPVSERAVVLDGERIPVRSMADAYLQVANWLIQQGHLRHSECPIHIGKAITTRYAIHTEPIYPTGRKFFSPRQLRNGLFLEVHGSRSQNKLNIQNLLQRYGYPPSTLQLIGFDEVQGTTRSPKRPTPTSPRQNLQRTSSTTERAVVLNGKRIPVQYIYEILIQTAEWLIGQGKLVPEDAPIPHMSHATDVVFRKEAPPTHPRARPRALSNGLVVDTYLGTNNILAHAHSLLHHYGYPPDTVQLEGFEIEAPAPPRKKMDRHFRKSETEKRRSDKSRKRTKEREARIKALAKANKG